MPRPLFEGTTTAPLLPIPAATLAHYTQTFQGFTPLEMSYIAGSNLRLGEAADPVSRILAMAEDTLLDPARTAVGAEALTPDKADWVPENQYADFIAAQEAGRQQLRAGACIGAAIMRDRAQTHGLPTLHADPGRRYLALPDRPDAAHILHAWQAVAGNVEVDLADGTAQGYFADLSSSQDVRALYEAWRQGPMREVVASDTEGYAAFGRICRGMMSVIRLYRILWEEEQAAPQHERTYDPAKHFLLQDQNLYPIPSPATTPEELAVDAEAWMHHYRRPVAGFDAVRTTPSQEGLETITRWDSMRVADGWRAFGIHTALARYVQLPDDPNRMVKVGIHASKRNYTLDLAEPRTLTSDRVIVETASGFRAVHPGESGRRTGLAPERMLALCRGGLLVPLGEGLLSDNAAIVDQGLLQLVVETLHEQQTGRPFSYDEPPKLSGLTTA